MSRHALENVRRSDALQQTVGYEQLEAYHVPFDELTGTTAVEAELTHWSTRRGKVAVIGPSGSGKSSVMAAVLGQLAEEVPDWLCPVRIPVELAEPEVITTTRAFAQHLVRQVMFWAAPEVLSEQQRQELDRGTADIERRTGRRRRGGFALGAPAWLVDAKLSGDLTGAAHDIQRELGAGDIVRQTRRMIELFRDREREPFLVFDDTDTWLRLPGEQEEAERLATGFFTNNVRMVAKELDVGFAVAVHNDYLPGGGYRQIAGLLTPIEIPKLEEPVDAIARILQRRLDVHDLGLLVADAFDEAALDYLSFVYDDAPDLRRVMGIASRSIAKALQDPDAERVGKAAVRAARAERDSLGGRKP